jgi:hypothetical protein
MAAKGNVNTGATARYFSTNRDLSVLFTARISNPANPADPAGYKGPRRKAAVGPRRGRVCPGCGIEAPLKGKCNNCW